MKRVRTFALVLCIALGCGDGVSAPTTPALTVGINAVPDAERGTVRITAWVLNEGPSLSYVDGCTGSGLVSPIEFELVDPPGIFVSEDANYPCGPPFLCPVSVRTLAAGVPDGYLERTLEFDGKLFVPDKPRAPRNGCDQILWQDHRSRGCEGVLLPPGRYTVVARFTYCTSEQSTAHAESAVTFEF